MAHNCVWVEVMEGRTDKMRESEGGLEAKLI